MDGPGSLISFELRGGLEAGVRMLNHDKLSFWHDTGMRELAAHLLAEPRALMESYN